jgi:hypothetical protein
MRTEIRAGRRQLDLLLAGSGVRVPFGALDRISMLVDRPMLTGVLLERPFLDGRHGRPSR